MPAAQPGRASWIATTLPLPVVVLLVYTFFSWLFFLTKSSVLSTVPWPERLAALIQTPGPFLPAVLTVQIVLTIIGALAFRHLRGLMVLPAGVITGLLGLGLVDDFTHVVFGRSIATVDARLRYGYAVLLLVLVALVSRSLYRWVAQPKPLPRATAFWIVAAPVLVTFAMAETKGAPPLGAPMESAEERRLASSGHGPNVLLLTVDGLDARRLSAYGAPAPTTPFLQSFRAETLFCENAFANSCRTHGSLVTLLTGKLATHTRVLEPPSVLEGDARYQHLPGILREHGYRTLQLTITYFASAENANLIGAFDLANYDWEKLGSGRVQQATDNARLFRLQVYDQLQERLARIFAGRSRSAFTSLMRSGTPQEYWRDSHRVETLLKFIHTTREPWMAHVHLLDTHPGNEHSEVADYNAAVRDSDRHIQTIVEALRRSGQLDRTILVIGSDHGRKWSTKARIPLMIRFPRGEHRGIVQENVQLADVAPTVLDAAGLAVPPWMDGVSLLRLSTQRPIISLCGDERHSGSATEHMLRIPNYGAAVAMVVGGAQWTQLTLDDGRIETGTVDGPADARANPSPESLSALQRHISAAGFRVGFAPGTEPGFPKTEPFSSPR